MVPDLQMPLLKWAVRGGFKAFSHLASLISFRSTAEGAVTTEARSPRSEEVTEVREGLLEPATQNKPP